MHEQPTHLLNTQFPMWDLCEFDLLRPTIVTAAPKSIDLALLLSNNFCQSWKTSPQQRLFGSKCNLFYLAARHHTGVAAHMQNIFVFEAFNLYLFALFHAQEGRIIECRKNS